MEEKKKYKPRGKSVSLKYTDEELIEWISKFERRVDMRRESSSKYMLCLRRGLNIYFPPKRTKDNNIAGVEKPVKEKKKRGRPRSIDKPEVVKKKSKSEEEVSVSIFDDKSKVDRTSPSRMFIATKLTGQVDKFGKKSRSSNIICGRCLEEKESYEKSNSVCKTCWMRIQSLKIQGKDTNKWNVRDIFTNTVIRHNEKVFNIGIKVDDKTREYLSTIGYSFIFKDEYEK